MEEDFSIFINNNWIVGLFNNTHVLLTVYCLYKAKVPLTKLECSIDIKQSNSPLACFSNSQQLCQFIKNSENIVFNYTQKLLTLKWKLSAINFQKNIECSLYFQEFPVQKVDILKCQNYLLKKKLCQYQGKKPITPSKTDNQISIELSKQKQNNITILKIQQQIYPHISISSDNQKKSSNTENKGSKSPIKSVTNEKKRRGRKSQSQKKLPQKQQKQLKKKKMITKDKKQKKYSQRRKTNKQQNIFGNQSVKSNKSKKNQQEIIQISQSKPFDYTPFSINDKSSCIVSKGQMKYKKTSYQQKNDKQIQQKGAPKKVRLQFENGDTYFGQAIKDVYNGYGVYKSKSGSYYEGWWKDGKAQGKGTSIDQFGNKYVGNFQEDKRHGEGVQTYQNGQKYEGFFKEDFKQGFGKYIYQNGDYYEGYWKQNKCEGKGRQVYVDGTIYQGIWSQDEKNGEGILMKSNGEKYKQIYKMGQLTQQVLIDNLSPKN